MELADAFLYLDDVQYGRGQVLIDEHVIRFTAEDGREHKEREHEVGQAQTEDIDTNTTSNDHASTVRGASHHTWEVGIDKIIVHALCSKNETEVDDQTPSDEERPRSFDCIYLQVEGSTSERSGGGDGRDGSDGEEGGVNEDDEDDCGFVEVRIALYPDTHHHQGDIHGTYPEQDMSEYHQRLAEVFQCLTDCVTANEGENFTGMADGFPGGDDGDTYGLLLNDNNNNGGNGGAFINGHTDHNANDMLTRFDRILDDSAVVAAENLEDSDARFENAYEDDDDNDDDDNAM